MGRQTQLPLSSEIAQDWMLKELTFRNFKKDIERLEIARSEQVDIDAAGPIAKPVARQTV